MASEGLLSVIFGIEAQDTRHTTCRGTTQGDTKEHRSRTVLPRPVGDRIPPLEVGRWLASSPLASVNTWLPCWPTIGWIYRAWNDLEWARTQPTWEGSRHIILLPNGFYNDRWFLLNINVFSLALHGFLIGGCIWRYGTSVWLSTLRAPTVRSYTRTSGRSCMRTWSYVMWGFTLNKPGLCTLNEFCAPCLEPFLQVTLLASCRRSEQLRSRQVSFNSEK